MSSFSIDTFAAYNCLWIGQRCKPSRKLCDRIASSAARFPLTSCIFFTERLKVMRKHTCIARHSAYVTVSSPSVRPSDSLSVYPRSYKCYGNVTGLYLLSRPVTSASGACFQLWRHGQEKCRPWEEVVGLGPLPLVILIPDSCESVRRPCRLFHWPIRNYFADLNHQIAPIYIYKKPVYDFLFDFNSNLGPILPRFGDIRGLYAESHFFSTPPLFGRKISGCSLWSRPVMLGLQRANVPG